MCTNPQHYLQNGELVMWPYATSYSVQLPGEQKVLNALPWSGGGETGWVERDPRVRHCSVLLSVPNQAMFAAVVGVPRKFARACPELPQDKRGQNVQASGAHPTR